MARISKELQVLNEILSEELRIEEENIESLDIDQKLILAIKKQAVLYQIAEMKSIFIILLKVFYLLLYLDLWLNVIHL
jgi:hypothetical protein